MIKMQKRRRERVEDENSFLSTMLVWAGLATISVPGLMLGSQTLTWLRDGYWPRLSIGEGLIRWGFQHPYTDWVGIQKMIDWVMTWPASFVIFLGLGLVTFLVSIPAGRVQAEMMEFHRQDRHAAAEKKDPAT